MTGKADTGDAAVAADGAEAKDSPTADKDEAGKAMRPRRIVRSRSTAWFRYGTGVPLSPRKTSSEWCTLPPSNRAISSLASAWL